MKVKIKDLKSNPFRDMKSYPIDSSKVDVLIASIKQTGFWDNILARKVGNKIEIAYGHHRLIALQKTMSDDDIVDIPVKPLDDATMLKVMANENMDEWKTNPAIIDETVKATKRFLEEHPKEAHKVGQIKSASIEANFIGALIIARFLGWEKTKVDRSLERIRMINEKIIDPEAIKSLPTEGSARSFIKAVKQFKPTHDQQKRVAQKISEMTKGERSEGAVRSLVTDEIY
ncbi:MAG: ParB N-terminal domain-containing protein, partial [Candidatus Hodarchaeota archaeon]